MKRFSWLSLGLLAIFAAPGCKEEERTTAPSVQEPPTVQVVQPQYRKITRVVGQPSFVEPYERTSIFPKVSGYIEKWYVDIGDKVKKGDTMCTLFVPELVEDRETKWRTVKLDEEKVRLAKQLVKVAAAKVKAAAAALKEAKEIVAKYKSDTDRWDSEVNRLDRETNRGVVDPQVLLESQNQYKMCKAAWMAALADVEKKAADLLAAEEMLQEDIVDVAVEEARVKVAESDAKRLDAWVGYLTIPAPFDGIVVARNANSWDFVLPATGDPTADHNAPHLSPSGKAAPIYVVDRTDIVRIFVDVPEADANYVRVGCKARVQIKGYRDEWIQGVVARTAWALNVKSRTLRAEIDLRNFNNEILPGMYAYGKVIIERNNVRALPSDCLTYSDDKAFYWSYEKGHAVRTEVQVGVSDGDWVEVTSRHIPTKASEESWGLIDGTEQVITGNTSELTDGCTVKLAGATGAHKGEVASAAHEAK